jgi:hypothetical protein
MRLPLAIGHLLVEIECAAKMPVRARKIISMYGEDANPPFGMCLAPAISKLLVQPQSTLEM